MVWESGCVVIVMLTPLSENGVKQCHHYWPDEGSDVYHIYEVRQYLDAVKFKESQITKKQKQTYFLLLVLFMFWGYEISAFTLIQSRWILFMVLTALQNDIWKIQQQHVSPENNLCNFTVSSFHWKCFLPSNKVLFTKFHGKFYWDSGRNLRDRYLKALVWILEIVWMLFKPDSIVLAYI